MRNEANIPDWVLLFKRKGTTVKKIGNHYYLYSATSKYVSGKTYPVSVQKYIGRITKDGLIEPERIGFMPGRDEILGFGDIFSLEGYTKKEQEILRTIPVVKVGGRYYTGILKSNQIKLISKRYDYENGEIRDYEL